MTEETTQDGQKTVVAFIAGLLVGGLLVWVFSDTPAEAPMNDDTAVEQSEVDTASDTMVDEVDDANSDEPVVEEEAAVLPTGDGSAQVTDPTAGSVVTLSGATFPTDDGWVAVRSYTDGQLGNILGASRYSREQGLVPEAIQLLVPTVAGREYAVVFFTENGDRQFDLSTDSQIDTELSVFTAQ